MNPPVLKTKCQTCPFREGSPYAHLSGSLALSALSEASRICHSTGPGNAVNRKPKGPAMLCRGARDIQIRVFHQTGFISEPTDEAWAAKLAQLQRFMSCPKPKLKPKAPSKKRSRKG